MATLKVTNIKNESFAGDQLYLKTDGKIGINQTSPQSLLSLGAGTDPIKLLLYDNANTNKYGFGIQANELRTFYPDNSRLVIGTIAVSDGSTFSEKIRIDSGGRVGIGVTPSASEGTELAIKSSDGATNIALVPNADTEFSQIGFYNAALDSTQGYIKYNNNDNSLQFRVNLGIALHINNSRNVGIGTTSPGYLLHVKNAGTADTAIKIESESGYDAYLALDSSNGGGAETDIKFQMDGTTKGTISYVNNAGSADVNCMIFRNNSNNERMKIKADGDIEVGGNLKTHNLTGNNLLINGAMTINQKNASSTSDGYQVADMWWWGKFGMDQAVTTQSNVTNDHPDGFDHTFKLTVGTAESSLDTNEWATLRTRIEGQNLQHLKTGTASAEEITLSFWAKTGSANNGDQYSVTIIEGDSSGNDKIQKRSFTATSSWQRFTMTYVGQTSHVIRNDNDYGMTIYFVLVAASNKLDAADTTWETNTASKIAVTGQSNFFDNTDNEFYITGVQLEVGSIATEFDHKLHGDELRRCQRYYQEIGTGSFGDYSLGTGYVYNNGNNLALGLYMSCPMRTSPTIAVTGNMNVRYPAGGSTQVDVNSPSIPSGMDINSHWLPVGWGITSDIGSNGDLASLNNSNNDGVTLSSEL